MAGRGNALVAIGVIGLPLGAHFTIKGAISIAQAWNVSETTIGLTVVALGTSLPELSTTLMAALRNHGAVAIGNVIGSNIFNLLAIVGITAAIVPIEVPQQMMQFDAWFMLATSAMLAPFVFMCWPISRINGAAMVAVYGCYMLFVYWSGSQVDYALAP